MDSFSSARPRLFGIAYRMLGSRAEAEDLLQDVWLRWNGVDQSTVVEPAAFLTTTTTRLALSHLQSAPVRRGGYIGPWLPEPVDTSTDPHLGAENAEAIELAVLVLLEKLNPAERAAYVLREAFDYPYEEIAQILELGEANVRQLVSRAKKHLSDERKKPVSSADQRKLLEAFVAAARRGDRAALERLFAEQVVSLSDGGGAQRAARRPVIGREAVARFISAFADSFWGDVELEWIERNSRPAVLIRRGEQSVALLALDASEEGIENLFWVMNPEKL